MLTQGKRKKRIDRQLNNVTGNWRRTNRHLSEPVSDGITVDLWMIYPWTCFCPSEHQKPLTSENAVNGETEDPWLICHNLKDDPQDKKVFPLNQSSPILKHADISQMNSYFELGVSPFSSPFHKRLVYLDSFISVWSSMCSYTWISKAFFCGVDLSEDSVKILFNHDKKRKAMKWS